MRPAAAQGHDARRRWRAGSILVVLFIAILMAAPTGLSAATRAATVGFNVDGYVYDWSTFGGVHAAVSGVEVTAWLGDGTWVASTVTDPAGRWHLVLPDGEYQIQFDARTRNASGLTHFLGGWYSDWSYNPVGQFSSSPLTVAGLDLMPADMYLDSGGSFSGHVSGGGVALADCGVQVVERDDQTGNAVEYAMTDVAGNYYVTVPAGAYKLYFDPNVLVTTNYLPRYFNLAKDSAHATILAVHKGDTVGVTNQALPLGGFVRGTVYKPGGVLPAAGVYVAAWWEGSQQGGGRVSAADGTYRIGPLEPGPIGIFFDPTSPSDWSGTPPPEETSFNFINGTSYVLQAYASALLSKPTTVTVAGGATTTGIDDTLSGGGGITYHVTDAGGNDLTGMKCYLGGAGGVSMEATTEAGGLVTFSGLPLDSYTLWGNPSTYNDPHDTDFVTTEYDDAPTVLATAATLAPASPMVMAYGARVSGRVTNAGSTGLSGVDVAAYTADGNDVPASSLTDGSGNYVLHGIPQRRIKVGFSSWQYNQDHGTDYVSEYASGKSTFRTADVMKVVAVAPPDPDTGRYAGVNAQLTTGATIGGTITGPTGTALDHAYVQLFDTFGNWIDSLYTVSGAYNFRAVPPGIYRVSAQYDDGSGTVAFPERWYNGKRWFSEANNITVGSGGIVTAGNIQLRAGPTLSGKVMREGTTTGIGGVVVLIRDSAGIVQDSAYTNPDGTWQSSAPSRLAPGSYRVQFDATEANETGPSNYGLAWYKVPLGTSAPVAASASQIVLDYGTVVTNVNGYLNETDSTSIHGTIVRRGVSGNPYEPGMDLWAQAWAMVGSKWTIIAGAPIDTATGNFNIRGLRPNQPYKLAIDDADKASSWGVLGNQFYVDSGPGEASVSWPQVAATITPSPAPGFDAGLFAVQKSGLFVVKSTDESDEPLENADVFMDFYSPTLGGWWPVDGGYMGYTMASGELDLPSEASYDVPLMPGSYRFRFERYGYDTVWYHDATSTAGAASVSLNPFDPLAFDPVWVEQQMQPSDLTTEQIAGLDRYQVAYDLASQAYGDFSGVTNVVIASGLDKSAADPLSAGGLAGVYHAPILLVRQDRSYLPAPTINALQAIAAANPSSKINVWIVGGPASVPDGLKARIALALGGPAHTGTTVRFGGLDRYAVAAGVSTHMRAKTGTTTCFITNGSSLNFFWDALAVSPVSYSQHFPVLLVKAGYIPPATAGESAKFKTRFVIGNTSHVAESVRTTLVADRIAGSTRADVAARFSEKAWERGWTGISTIAVGNKLADSLVGGASIGAMGGSLLYTGDGVNKATTLDPKTYQFLLNYQDHVTNVYLLGGSGSIDQVSLMGKINEALGK